MIPNRLLLGKEFFKVFTFLGLHLINFSLAFGHELTEQYAQRRIDSAKQISEQDQGSGGSQCEACSPQLFFKKAKGGGRLGSPLNFAFYI